MKIERKPETNSATINTIIIILKNPESYDKDILNKTKYAFYIGKNLYKIEDTLSTEITRNTTDNIILYAKPTITSKTTNILVLKLSQHQYLTITPENYESYIFNNELIGVDEDTNIIFKGDFINKGQISITTPGIIINGENATFTNTSFELDDVNITIKNMKINNTDTTEYTIKSAGNNNKIINNTIYTYNTNGKTAAIANTGGSNMKFYKMDDLCKLGYTAVEYLLKEKNFQPEEIGILLVNAAASLNTDIRHQMIINQEGDHAASPTVFVYTLPNVVAGEICIRHKIQGENTFFIEKEFDADKLEEYARIVMKKGNLKACITGWCNLLMEEYKADFKLIEVQH